MLCPAIAIQKDYYTFSIDIYSTNSVSDLVNMFGKTIIDTLRPIGRSAWEKFLMVLSSLRSEISFDINGAPVWGIGIGVLKTEDIHPPKTGISVHFSGSLV